MAMKQDELKGSEKYNGNTTGKNRRQYNQVLFRDWEA